MRSKILFALSALALIPATTPAADYPLSSSSSDYYFMTMGNTGSNFKIMLDISSYVNARGININLGNNGFDQTLGITTYIYGGEQSYNYSYDGWTSGGESSENYGLNVVATGNSYSTNYGVYSRAYVYGGGGYSAAGYFAGDVYADNYYSTSDRKFKKDIQDITGGLSTVMALKPRTYTMRTEEFKDKMAFSDGKKLGFIAQELETVLPELVKEAVAPAHLTKEEKEAKVKKEPTKYKSVDYVGVIPVLVAAIQEQQAQALEQKKQIESLRAEVAALKAGK